MAKNLKPYSVTAHVLGPVEGTLLWRMSDGSHQCSTYAEAASKAIELFKNSEFIVCRISFKPYKTKPSTHRDLKREDVGL